MNADLLPFTICATVLLAVVLLEWAVLRFYVMIRLCFSCRKCRAQSIGRGSEALCPFRKDIEKMVSAAAGKLVWTQLLLLVLSVVFWLFGNASIQAAALQYLRRMCYISCGIYVVHYLTGMVTVFCIGNAPDCVHRKTSVGMKDRRFMLFLSAVLFVVVHWLLSL